MEQKVIDHSLETLVREIEEGHLHQTLMEHSLKGHTIKMEQDLSLQISTEPSLMEKKVN